VAATVPGVGVVVLEVAGWPSRSGEVETGRMTERGMASVERDRRGFLRGAAAAVAAVGTGVLLSGSAHGVPASSRAGKVTADLPPAGAEFPCSMYAANVPLKLNMLGALTLDFKGGIKLRVRRSETDGLGLEVQGFRMEADLSPSTPNAGTIIVMTMSNVTLAPLSTLTTSDMLLLIHLPLTFTSIDKATGEETVMASTDPAKYATLRSEDVKEFPPAGRPWTLQEPVTLYQPGTTAAEGEPVGVLEGFNAIVNQSSLPE
jgi:hypothetical protein